MTKKTDSLIFRYGIQTLWKNTNFLFKTSVSNSFFFKFLKFELKQRNFELLSIEQKKHNIISAFVFCFFWKNMVNVLENQNTVLIYKIILYYRYWFLFQILYTLFNILIIQKLAFLNITFLLYFTKLNYINFCKYDYSYPVDDKLNLQRLFFKIEQIRLESSLSYFFNRPFIIKLHNVFNLPLYFDFVQLYTRINKTTTFNLTTLEFMLYLSCKLRMISIFTRFLAKALELENKHRKVLWSVVNAVNILSTKLFLFKSMRIYVNGKLNGKMRRKTYSFKLGRLAIQQISSDLDYFKATSFTKFGTISVKIWIFF